MVNGNGRTGEFLRWVLTLVLGGLVAYFTAQGAIETRIAVVEERELNHYAEIIRQLHRMEAKQDRLDNKIDLMP
jgi:hypothetical protein